MSEKTQMIIFMLGVWGGGLGVVLFLHYASWRDRRKSKETEK